MSLLDDVSIVVTPNGYKARTLFGAIPVPTEGSDLVTGANSATTVAGTYTDVQTNYGGAIGDVLKVTFTLGGDYGLKISSWFNYFSINSDIEYNSGVNVAYIRVTGNNYGNGDLRFNNQATSTVGGTISDITVKVYVSADMDVTRATAATRVDENGLVNYAEVLGEDLVDDGNFPLPNTEWSLTGGAEVTALGGRIYSSSGGVSSLDQNIGMVVGNKYKITLDVIATDGTKLSNPNGTNIYDTSTVGSKVFYITAAYSTLYFKRYTGITDVTINNVSVKEVTRDNVPRIDYSGCPHILAEPQRTNLLTYSEDFSNAIYIKDSTVSVGTTNNVSPSGESNATKIDVTASGRIYSNVTTDTYVSSIFIKAGTFAYFKLAGVQVDLVAETNANGTIKSLDNGWFKVGVNYTGNRPFQIQAYPDGTYSSHTTTGDYYIWGSQIEAGSYATSYIPTSGSTVTRNQDQFSRDGIGSLINSTEGTFFIELSKPIDTVDAYQLISLNNNAANSDRNSVTIGFMLNTNKLFIRVKSSGSNVFQSSNQVSNANTFYKVAVSYKSGESKIFVNGSSITPNSGNISGTFTFDAILDKLSFDYNGNNGLPFYGNVRQLQVYKTALTDVQLEALTT